MRIGIGGSDPIPKVSTDLSVEQEYCLENRNRISEYYLLRTEAYVLRIGIGGSGPIPRVYIDIW